ncbi:MAG: hypothetical protein QOE89_2995, partial [Pseudonocardiales bacterium]|nr:hypothetical protein [Pseudonocardiales bacterium]
TNAGNARTRAASGIVKAGTRPVTASTRTARSARGAALGASGEPGSQWVLEAATRKLVATATFFA